MRTFIFPIQLLYTYFCCLFYVYIYYILVANSLLFYLVCKFLPQYDISYLGGWVRKRNVETFLVATLIWMSPQNWLTGFYMRGAFPGNIYLFKVNNRSTRKRCEMCSKLTMEITEGCQRHHSGVFIDNFEHISPLFLVFLLLIFWKSEC